MAAGADAEALAKQLETLQLKAHRLEEELDTVALAASRTQALEAENAELKAAVESLTQQNQALHDRLTRLSSTPQTDGAPGATAAADMPPPPPAAAAAKEDIAAPFTVPAPWRGLRCVATLSNVNGGLNVLCARPHPSFPDLVASGGVDKRVVVSHVRADGTFSTLASLALAAPVLSLDFRPLGAGALLAAGLMDGSLQLLRLAPTSANFNCTTSSGTGLGGSAFRGLDPLPRAANVAAGGAGGVSTEADGSLLRFAATHKDHSKYVVCVRWSRDGALLATASHDKTVTLYRSTSAAGDATPNDGHCSTASSSAAAAAVADASPQALLEVVTKLYFSEAVEAVEFVGGGESGDRLRLVVAAREQPHLTYVDVSAALTNIHASAAASSDGTSGGATAGSDSAGDGGAFAQERVSVNANEWDTHVSFSVMGLAASPDARYLLAATDRARLVLYRAGHNAHVRTLVGHATDAFFQPRAAWAVDGKFSVCNSMGAQQGVVAHCLVSGRVVDRAGGHAGAVRDVCSHPRARFVYTASFDKSVKVWEY